MRWIFLVLSDLVCRVSPYTFANEFSPYDTDDYHTAFVNVTWKDAATNVTYSDAGEIAKYGSGKIGNVEGLVVHVKTRNGSSSQGCDFPFEVTVPSEPWIALIERGGCDFDHKIRNAHRMKASAVAIYNNQSNEYVFKMKIKNKEVISIFLPKSKGELMVSLVDNATRVVMSIKVSRYFSNKPYTLNKTSILFVSISFVVLMIISLAWLIFYYIQRFRYIHEKDKLSKRLCNAAKKALSRIPERTLRTSDKEIQSGSECCPVCIEYFRSFDVVRILPCRHEFHKSCVDPWLLEKQTCPMCKMDILKHYGLVLSSSHESVFRTNDYLLSESNDSNVYSALALISISPRQLLSNDDSELQMIALKTGIVPARPFLKFQILPDAKLSVFMAARMRLF